MKFVFVVETDIPKTEEEGFLDAFNNKKFEFFHYLADNQAKIKRISLGTWEDLCKAIKFKEEV